MSEYTYKRQTAEDIELSEEVKKTERDFLDQMKAEIYRTVKELKEEGYTDEEITLGFRIATAKLFYGSTCKPGGIVADNFVPKIKVVDGVPVCVNGNPEEVVIKTDELKKAFGL